MSHHRDLANEALQSAIEDPETLDLETIATCLEAMSVRGIWATPDSSSAFLHVDYTIGKDRTQYVLTVLLDRNGTIRSVDMES